MNNFEELEVWKLARQLRMNISVLVKKFHSEEKYRFVDQMVRASRSVTANIAEGFGRFHFQENIQFCRQSRGSLTELIHHLYCAFDEELIDIKQFDSLKNEIQQVLKLLNGYILYLKNAKSQTT